MMSFVIRTRWMPAWMMLVACLPALATGQDGGQNGGKDGGLCEVLSALATEEIVRQLEEKSWPIDRPVFSGTITAVNPKQETRVDIEKFELANDRFSLELKAQTLVTIKGRLQHADQAADVQATVRVETNVKGSVTLAEMSGKFFATPHVADLDGTFEVIDIQPENLAGGKAAISNLINLLLRERKQQILERINRDAKPREIP